MMPTSDVPPPTSERGRARSRRSALSISVPVTLSTLLVLAPTPGRAELRPADPDVLRLSLAEAIEAALVRSYAMRLARVDRGKADAEIRNAFSALYPQLDALVSYQRTFLTPNPFAGSDAADLFTGANTQDWLAFNERVRREQAGTDTGLAISPGDCDAAFDDDGDLRLVTFEDYTQCLTQGRSAPGIDLGSPSDNPFLVENTVRAGLSASQLLYSGSAFAGIRAAKTAGDLAEAELERTGQTVVRDVAQAYYQVLLAEQQVEVLEKSVARTRETAAEVEARVKEGVVPQFELLSVEVELANTETELVNARNAGDSARDGLAFAIGVPLTVRLRLTDPLVLPRPAPAPPSLEEAIAIAVDARPDLRAARLNVELRKVAEEVTIAGYFPELRLVADLTAVGNVPDDRGRVFASPNESDRFFLPQNPFAFEGEERGIFDEAYWGTNFTAGLNLTWTLFDGFATRAQEQDDELEIVRAQIQREQLAENVRLEVARERRNLTSALERVAVQDKNVERAELNYRHTELRVKEGVSSQLELREASQQLDQSRFNRLQAIHDYLVARASFEVAIGRPPFARDEDPQR